MITGDSLKTTARIRSQKAGMFLLRQGTFVRDIENLGRKLDPGRFRFGKYEIVKADDSFEVQIDFDQNSNKASNVDVTMNAWKTDATKIELKQHQTQARR